MKLSDLTFNQQNDTSVNFNRPPTFVSGFKRSTRIRISYMFQLHFLLKLFNVVTDGIWETQGVSFISNWRSK